MAATGSEMRAPLSAVKTSGRSVGSHQVRPTWLLQSCCDRLWVERPLRAAWRDHRPQDERDADQCRSQPRWSERRSGRAKRKAQS